MPEINDKPIRLFHFITAVSAASREFGIKIAGEFDVEFAELLNGQYAIDPNDAKLRWRDS